MGKQMAQQGRNGEREFGITERVERKDVVRKRAHGGRNGWGVVREGISSSRGGGRREQRIGVLIPPPPYLCPHSLHPLCPKHLLPLTSTSQSLISPFATLPLASPPLPLSLPPLHPAICKVLPPLCPLSPPTPWHSSPLPTPLDPPSQLISYSLPHIHPTLHPHPHPIPHPPTLLPGGCNAQGGSQPS